MYIYDDSFCYGIIHWSFCFNVQFSRVWCIANAVLLNLWNIKNNLTNLLTNLHYVLTCKHWTALLKFFICFVICYFRHPAGSSEIFRFCNEISKFVSHYSEQLNVFRASFLWKSTNIIPIPLLSLKLLHGLKDSYLEILFEGNFEKNQRKSPFICHFCDWK